MGRFTLTVSLAGAFLAGLGAASAQQTGQFGQRTGGGSYVPSTHDPGCAGLLCSPLPSGSTPGGVAGSPSDVAPPPPCQGLLCSATPYSMQHPYTAAEAAEIDRQRAAALAQQAAAVAPPPEAAPLRHLRKRRKIAKVAKAVPPKAVTAASVRAKAAPAARTPAPADDGIQSLR